MFELLTKYEKVFPSQKDRVGLSTSYFHEIDTGGSAPFRQDLPRSSIFKREEISRQIKEMLSMGIIGVCSACEWASNVVLAQKKVGEKKALCGL